LIELQPVIATVLGMALFYFVIGKLVFRIDLDELVYDVAKWFLFFTPFSHSPSTEADGDLKTFFSKVVLVLLTIAVGAFIFIKF